MVEKGRVCRVSHKDFMQKRKMNYLAIAGIFFALLLFIF